MANALSDLEAYLFVTLGVLAGVAIPILSGYIRERAILGGGAVALPPWLRKYALLFAFCLLVALLVLAYWRQSHPDDELVWYAAVLIGFAWESAIEKISLPPKSLDSQ